MLLLIGLWALLLLVWLRFVLEIRIPPPSSPASSSASTSGSSPCPTSASAASFSLIPSPPPSSSPPVSVTLIHRTQRSKFETPTLKLLQWLLCFVGGEDQLLLSEKKSVKKEGFIYGKGIQKDRWDYRIDPVCFATKDGGCFYFMAFLSCFIFLFFPGLLKIYLIK